MTLTARRRKILELTEQKKTAKEIAKQLGCSTGSVHTARSQLRKAGHLAPAISTGEANQLIGSNGNGAESAQDLGSAFLRAKLAEIDAEVERLEGETAKADAEASQLMEEHRAVSERCRVLRDELAEVAGLAVVMRGGQVTA